MLLGAVAMTVVALVLGSSAVPAGDALGYTQLWVLPAAGSGGSEAEVGVRSQQQSSVDFDLRVRIGADRLVRRSFRLAPVRPGWSSCGRLPAAVASCRSWQRCCATIAPSRSTDGSRARWSSQGVAMSPRAGDLVVDIVINNHNYGAFLESAIESACGQTHERVNVLAVDDGSTDDSRQILARYGDRIGLIMQENGGQAAALNAGMERCRGDVVIFLDADDVLRPEAAARVAAAFAADADVSKVQFRMETIDADGQPTGELKPAAHLPLPSGDVREAELAYPYDLVWMATSANAFRAEAVRRILPIPVEQFPVTGADWYLVHLTALLGRVVSLDTVGAGYRVHGDNSYELAAGRLDLDHLRQAIGFAASTSRRAAAPR